MPIIIFFSLIPLTYSVSEGKYCGTSCIDFGEAVVEWLADRISNPAIGAEFSIVVKWSSHPYVAQILPHFRRMRSNGAPGG